MGWFGDVDAEHRLTPLTTAATIGAANVVAVTVVVVVVDPLWAGSVRLCRRASGPRARRRHPGRTACGIAALCRNHGHVAVGRFGVGRCSAWLRCSSTPAVVDGGLVVLGRPGSTPRCRTRPRLVEVALAIDVIAGLALGLHEDGVESAVACGGRYVASSCTFRSRENTTRKKRTKRDSNTPRAALLLALAAVRAISFRRSARATCRLVVGSLCFSRMNCERLSPAALALAVKAPGCLIAP